MNSNIPHIQKVNKNESGSLLSGRDYGKDILKQTSRQNKYFF
jgi:hypothetical protein